MFRLSSIVAVTFLITNISASPVLPLPPDYQFFNSSIYPGYGVRFVNPTMCDPNVTQYAGYLDMGADHHHFWFFESKNNPVEDPVTLWITGGPGCTSQIGVWQDNSPCLTRDGSTIEYRETTWTHSSNMFYIDQPTGTGFSYGDDELPLNLNQSTPVLYKAMQLFYEAFPKYSKLPLHLFGESFGGRMAAVFANYVIEQNQKLQKSIIMDSKEVVSRQIIPLKSLALGNSQINPMIQKKVNSDLACDPKFGLPLSEETCRTIDLLEEACSPLIERCYEEGDPIQCGLTDLYCILSFMDLFNTADRNINDIRENIEAQKRGQEYIYLLNKPDIQRAIGAKYKALEKCEWSTVNVGMRTFGEGSFNTAPIIEALLDYDLPILVYAGDQDFGASWYGQMEMLSMLNFNGSEQYKQVEMKPWTVQDKEYGQAKSTDKLTFVRVYGSGHEVAFSQPERSLAMFTKWINDRRF